MAIFSYRMGDRVRRGAGQSAVRVAAYQAREKYTDTRTGYAYNYQPREKDGHDSARGIAAASAYIDRDSGYEEGRMPALFVGLYAPKDAPAWCHGSANIEQFWSRAELAERRQDAQIAERIIIALPHELTLKQNIWLLQDHVKEFTRQSRVVQVAIHAPEHGDGRNIHAHLLVSMRGVDEHGFKASKAETQHRYLHRREYVTNLRERWTEAANRHLGRHGYAARIDHRNLADQGVDRAPTIHLGPGDSRRERHGERSAAGEVNREVSARNAQHAALSADIPAIDRAVAHKAAGTRKAPRVATTRDTTLPVSGGPQRSRKSASENAEPYWRNLINRAAAHKADERGKAQGVPTARAAPFPASGGPQIGPGGSSQGVSPEQVDIAQLQREAIADRVPSGWRDLTVTDVARELSPAYADQLKVIKRLKETIAKTSKAVDFRQRDLIDHNEQRDLRWQNLKWFRKALHKIGWRDREIKKHETAAQRASKGFDRMRVRRWALGGALDTAERQAARELEKVKPQAETVLAERQKTAVAARATLAELQRQTVRESEKEAQVQQRTQRRGFRFGA